VEGTTILLGVGATKAGTTWLWDHLSRHPECHARAIKELHYFDTVENGAWGRQIRVQQALAARIARTAAAGRGNPARLAQRAADVAEWLAVLRRRVEDVPAYLAYLCGGARGGRRVVMDVTPAYASLPEARLRRMAGMAGDVRFVYLMRDPVARFWSHVRMIAGRTVRSAAEVPAAARALLDAVLGGQPSAAVDRGDYAGALARLDAAVAPGRLLVLFQEELMTAPGYARLCAFLGIAPGQPDFGRRVFATTPAEMTGDQRARLAQFLAPQYAAVAARGPLPAAWRRSMEGVAG
jgi:hypothetical protein